MALLGQVVAVLIALRAEAAQQLLPKSSLCLALSLHWGNRNRDTPSALPPVSSLSRRFYPETVTGDLSEALGLTRDGGFGVVLKLLSPSFTPNALQAAGRGALMSQQPGNRGSPRNK